MTRQLRLWGVAAVAVALLILVSQVATAQPPERGRNGERGGERGGPGGPGGPGGRFRGGSGAGFGQGSAIRLASVPEVQKALKLNDEQKTKIEDLEGEYRDNFRKVFQDGGGADPREGIDKVNKEAADKLKELLDDDQEKRLRGISIQVIGPMAVIVYPELATDLKITDEQKKKLEDAQKANMEAMGETFRSARESDSNEDPREKMEKLRKEHQQKLLDVLTDEQKKQLEELKGEKVDVDVMRLRGGGGGDRNGGRFGSGGGGRGGRGERRDRDSDNDNKPSDSESKSESN